MIPPRGRDEQGLCQLHDLPFQAGSPIISGARGRGPDRMFLTIAAILSVLWSLGWASGAQLGFWLHGFLLAAMVFAGVGLFIEGKPNRNRET